MSEQLTTIRLYGKLGTKFGRVHRLAVDSPAESIRALAALYPGFQAHLTGSKEQGVAYAVFLDKKNLSEEQLRNPCGNKEIRIAPIIIGSKRNGVFQTILGIAMVVVAGIATVASGGTFMSVFGASGLWGTVASVGVSMAIGGIVQMLAPQPRGMAAADDPSNRASHGFNGPVNTQAQGNPVPVLYGRLIVGSAVISAGISVDEEVYVAAGGYCESESGALAYRRRVEDPLTGEEMLECVPEPTPGGSDPYGATEGHGGTKHPIAEQ